MALSEAVRYCVQKSQNQLVGRWGGTIGQFWLIKDEFSLWKSSFFLPRVE